MRFEDAKTPEELISSLKDCVTRLQNSYDNKPKYVYHYTRIETARAIFKDKKWYLGSPSRMNDGLELLNIEDNASCNFCFTCFSEDKNENMGMWSMYAQPWSKGIILRIPFEKIKVWEKAKVNIYMSDPNTKECKKLITDAKLFFHRVAYVDTELNSDFKHSELSCGGQTNKVYSGNFVDETLAGYIKNNAWDYEKELRLRVEINRKQELNAVVIDIPEDVLNSIDIITGPRCNLNILNDIRKNVDARFDNSRVLPSIFTGRLNWVYCDSCKRN